MILVLDGIYRRTIGPSCPQVPGQRGFHSDSRYVDYRCLGRHRGGCMRWRRLTDGTVWRAPPNPGSPSTSVESVTVSPAQSEIVVGDTVRLSATPTDESGSPVDTQVEWSSLAGSVATVDPSDFVRGETTGSARVVATSQEVSDTAVVAVVTQPTCPQMPDDLSVTEMSRSDMSVEFEASWTDAERAVRYDWDAGSNSGRWRDRASNLRRVNTVFVQ